MKQAVWERDQAGQVPTIVSQNFSRNLSPSFARQLIQLYMLHVTLVSAEFSGNPYVYDHVLSISRVLKGRVESFALFMCGDNADRKVCFRRASWTEVRGTLSDILKYLKIESFFLADFNTNIHLIINQVLSNGLERCRMRPQQNIIDDPWSEINYSLHVHSCVLEGSYFCETNSNELIEGIFSTLQLISDELSGATFLVPDAGTFKVSYKDCPPLQ